MTTIRTRADHGGDVLARAKALAEAIGESPEFRAFEAAQEALEADTALSERLAAAQVREQGLRTSRAWGGADPEEERALAREWEEIASHPVLAAHMAAREKLVGLLGDVSATISTGAGIDFGSACAPAGGCC